MSRTALRVGDLLDPRVTRHPEASHYALDPRHEPSAHHRLTVYAERPEPAELAAFRAGGRVDLALLAEGPVVLLLWRGDGWPWSDAPFSWHLQTRGVDPPPVPSVEPLPPGAGVPLDMILVDASTGRIAAMRKVAMPGAFALELHYAIGEQALVPHGEWDCAACDAAVKALAAEPCEALARRAAARCTVGGRS